MGLIILLEKMKVPKVIIEKRWNMMDTKILFLEIVLSLFLLYIYSSASATINHFVLCLIFLSDLLILTLPQQSLKLYLQQVLQKFAYQLVQVDF